MSEHGYGWWQAADGQWYPPEQHPSYKADEPSYGWWQAADGNSYPPNRHPDYRAAPTTPASAGAPPTMPPPSMSSPTPPPGVPDGTPSVSGSSAGGFDIKALGPIMLGFLGSCLLVVIGSFLPWAKIDLGFISQTTGGLDGDGGITLALALIAGALAFFSKGRNFGLTVGATIAAALCLVIAIIDVLDVSSVSGDLGIDSGVSVGYGLWLVLIASIAATGLGVKMLLDARKAS